MEDKVSEKMFKYYDQQFGRWCVFWRVLIWHWHDWRDRCQCQCQMWHLTLSHWHCMPWPWHPTPDTWSWHLHMSDTWHLRDMCLEILVSTFPHFRILIPLYVNVKTSTKMQKGSDPSTITNAWSYTRQQRPRYKYCEATLIGQQNRYL